MTAAGIFEENGSGPVDEEDQSQVAIRPEENFVKLARVNGWNWPLHPLQVTAWIAILYMAVFYFLTTVPSLVIQWQYAAYIVIGISTIIHLICLLTCTSINAADQAVVDKMRQGDRSVQAFNRAIHGHVIVNQHCNICGLDVSSKSKHCRACDKCVDTFDHHCVWLNNCIGARNYRVFIAMLGTAVLTLLLIFIILTVELVAYYTDKHNGDILIFYEEALEAINVADESYTTDWTNSSQEVFVSASSRFTTVLPSTSVDPQFKVFYADVPRGVWLAFLIIGVVLCVLGLALLTHLFLFHLYLMYKGLTTFDYINLKSEREEAAAREKIQQEDMAYQTKAKRTNRVAPGESLYEENGAVNSTRPRPSKYEYQSECGSREIYMEMGQTPDHTSRQNLCQSQKAPCSDHKLNTSHFQPAAKDSTKSHSRQSNNSITETLHYSEALDSPTDNHPITPVSTARSHHSSSSYHRKHQDRIHHKKHLLPEIHHPSLQSDAAGSKRRSNRHKRKASAATTNPVKTEPVSEGMLYDPEVFLPISSRSDSRILASGPPTEYHSDSADSLHEIPVVRTRTGLYQSSLPKDSFPPYAIDGRSSRGLSEKSATGALHRAKRRKKRLQQQLPAESHNNITTGPDGDASLVAHVKNHIQVPPLDLSTIHSDDTEQSAKSKNMDVSQI